MKLLKNERGIALVMVLVLSLISLAIISALVYLTIQGTRFSGFYKRYESARESGIGGSEIAAALIQNRGVLSIPGYDIVPGSGTDFPNLCNCNDIDNCDDNRDSLDNRTCLCDKLCNPPYCGGAYKWTVAGCDTSLDPTSNPDMQFNLSGLGTTNYQVSVKIIDTTRGNTDLSGQSLGGTGVVSSNSGQIPAPPMPYLYRVEINSQDAATVIERARLSGLYAF